MVRTFRLQTVGAGTSQPAFGDVMTAAMKIPSSTIFEATITVADATLWAAGDRIILSPGNADQDVVLVDSINTVANTLAVRSEGNRELKPHASTTVMALSINAARITVFSLTGNSAVIWTGADKTVTSAGAGNAIISIAAALNWQYDMASVGGMNPVNTYDLWIAGAAGNKFVAFANVN